MDDESEPPKDYPLTPAKMSKTPSWIMLGFILGALFVWSLPRDEKPAPPAAAKRAAPAEPARIALTTLTTIEAVFEAYGKNAVWDNDTTEVVLDSGKGTFSEFYEVKRSGDTYYYRSITKLTRRPIPPQPTCPLQFTETEDHYRAWLQQGRTARPPEPAPASALGVGGAAATKPATDQAAPKFRGLQVFDVSKLDQPRPAKVEPPPVLKVEKPPVEVPPKP